MTEKNYLMFLKVGVYASLITLFLCFSAVMFPFITSKQFVFNILIEVLLVFYLIFIIKYPAYRPQKSLITYGLLAFFGAMIVSLFFSVDVNLSFWGDLERMLGIFHLLHFLALYFITISVFRTKKDYYFLFNAMLLACLIIAIAMLSASPTGMFSQSLLGNRAYLAAFMLFAIFLSLLMFFKHKEWWQRGLFLAYLFIFIAALIRADISGSHAGLVAGIFVALLVFSLFNQNKKIKIIGFVILLGFVVLVSSLFYFRAHPVFNESYLGKALRSFSRDNVTLNTRLISWRAAGQYLIDNPVNLAFGVGHGNYALIFDKYFDADFYNYDRHATYFDRAHNNLIDIVTTTGLLGLISYLSLMAFLVFILIKVYNKNRQAGDEVVKVRSVNIMELSLLLGLLSAYFVQNLAVFDSFSSYMYITFFMSFVCFLEISNKENNEEKITKNKSKISESVLFFIFTPIFLILIFNINVRGLNSATKIIDVHTAIARGDASSFYELSRELMNNGSVFLRDVRDSYISLVSSNFQSMLEKNSFEELEKIVLLAIEAVEANLKYNPSDNLTLSRASVVYDLAGRFYNNSGDEERAVFYNNLALEKINLAINYSPERVPLYYNKAMILLNFNKSEEALETLDYAQKINPQIPDAFCQSAHFNFILQNKNEFLSNLEICIKNKGIELLNFNTHISSYEKNLYENNDFSLLIEMYNILLEYYPENTHWRSNLLSSYYNLGEYDLAKEQALKLREIDSSYNETVENFINNIQEVNLNQVE